MNAAVLDELRAAGARGDATRVVEIATQTLSALSPSGQLISLVDLAERTKQLHLLEGRFDEAQAVLAHLWDETLVSKLETDFALVVPTLVNAATSIEQYVIPMLASLVGPPCSGLLAWGLLIACKVAHAALLAWSAKRLDNVKKGESK